MSGLVYSYGDNISSDVCRDGWLFGGLSCGEIKKCLITPDRESRKNRVRFLSKFNLVS